jgi:hypothetical protein
MKAIITKVNHSQQLLCICGIICYLEVVFLLF